LLKRMHLPFHLIPLSFQDTRITFDDSFKFPEQNLI
jgi:hypothetical protein